jgi:hypothetical protein
MRDSRCFPLYAICTSHPPLSHPNAAAFWRRKQELVQALEFTAPQLGGDVSGWSMTLRNAHERYLQVGGYFSGLFLSAKDADPAARPLVTVRVPHDEGRATAAGGAPAAAASQAHRQRRHKTRRWEDSGYLAQRLAAAKKQLRVLQPHKPEAERLVVCGKSAESAAWEACQSPVSLADVEELLRAKQPELFEEYMVAKTQSSQAAEAMAAACEQHVTCVAARAAAHQEERQGPHLVVSSSRILLAGVAGDEGATAVLSVTSKGTAVVYYRWSPVADEAPGTKDGGGCISSDAEQEDGGEEGHADGGDESPAPSPAEQQAEAAGGGAGGGGGGGGGASFYLSDRAGVILPSETRDFVFTFRAPAAGMYDAAWAMATTPPLPAADMFHRAGEPLVVALRGVAAARELGQAEGARLRLEAGMARREGDRQVRVLL